ncbi:cytochrome P450 [Rhodoplanes sp. Z2-YC6860]|uniref:cytochrome P450 n=1 Tax=Rhodoplanes sp. Z2-YC6860 TaxID=674703 RepID=UPI00078EE991|nr:cytochrome P450 [Rhodoplanes sp. Z2-YC6860]AMN42642.1 Peroxidase [Rhodoplanes sp. Z2-YC6860]
MTAGIDFTSQEFFRNPAAAIEKLRASGAVVDAKLPIIGRTWITTTQDIAGQVLKDSETFTLRKDGNVAGMRWWMPRVIRVLSNNMLTTDEPDHSRLRGIVDEAFRRRAVLEMRPHIMALADQLAGELFSDGAPADLMVRYARRLPLSVICELLGLPLADRPKFIAWSNRLINLSSLAGFVLLIPSILSIKHYLEQHIEAVGTSDGEGLIGELVRARKDGAQISNEEMVSTIFLLLFAGHETTTHLIGGSVFELLKNPALRDWLEEDWSRADLAVEEFLRFVSPVQFSKPRFVKRDMELGGAALKRGDKIMAMVAAANMDPDANETPGRLDLARRPNRHVAFGAGIHFCLGHQLARVEGKCALEALFKRWPKLRLATAPADIRWRKRLGIRALEGLPVAAQ